MQEASDPHNAIWMREVTACTTWPQVLGKRLGKSMGAVAKAISTLSPEQIRHYEQKGSIDVAGQHLVTGEIKACVLDTSESCTVDCWCPYSNYAHLSLTCASAQSWNVPLWF